MGESLSARGGSAAVEGTRSRYFRSQWRGGWLCASPWIIGFIAFYFLVTPLIILSTQKMAARPACEEMQMHSLDPKLSQCLLIGEILHPKHDVGKVRRKRLRQPRQCDAGQSLDFV